MRTLGKVMCPILDANRDVARPFHKIKRRIHSRHGGRKAGKILHQGKSAYFFLRVKTSELAENNDFLCSSAVRGRVRTLPRICKL